MLCLNLPVQSSLWRWGHEGAESGAGESASCHHCRHPLPALLPDPSHVALSLYILTCLVVGVVRGRLQEYPDWPVIVLRGNGSDPEGPLKPE